MTKNSTTDNNSIAVVGMNCIYPGAHNYDELWTNILAGRRFFRKFPDERLPLDDYYDPNPYAAGKSYCDLMAVIDGWSFDPLDYNTPPVTFHSTDMVHWLALDVTRCALLDSGIDLNSIDKTKTGVIIGNSLGGEFARSHYLRFRWPYVSRSLRKVLEHSGKSSGQIDSLLKSFKVVYDAPLPP
ncbi:polyketide synthase, partial [bacterium]|nr:polyketide synthase [bacterium]